ncbi:MAG: methyl-accepting chemotaxis protein [Treponema sp.]|nr:methyl-accepting chemotaxis protein [Treponema sp.]
MAKFRFNLSVKIILLVSVLLVLSNIFLGTDAIKLSVKNFGVLTDKTLMQAADIVSSRVRDFTNTQFTLLDALANIGFVKDEDVPLEEKCKQLKNVTDIDHTKYENIAFYDADGNTYKADGSTMSLASSPYFKAAMEGKRYVSPPALNPHTGTVLMFFAVPVKSDSGENIGAMVSVLKGNPISDMIAEVDIGGGLHPVVIDLISSNYVAFANEVAEGQEDSQAVLDPESDIMKVFNNLFSGQSGVASFYNPMMGMKVYASYRPVYPENPFGSVTPWTIFCPAPYDAYFGGLNKLRVSVFGTLAVFLVLGLVIGIIMVRMMIKPVRTVKATIEGIATGNADLTQRIALSTNDEVGDVVKSFNMFTEKLQSIITQVKASKDELVTAGSDLESSSQDTVASIDQIISKLEGMLTQIQNQNNSVTETAGAVNQIASNIESLDRMIENQGRGIMDASSAVEEMVGNINSVTSSMDKMAESFNELSVRATQGEKIQKNATDKIELIKKQSNSLQEANVAISSIASQTNLLAMNAAIEAAHAGEAGKGFAVVADEIRKLSETSAVQSKKIGEELKAIVSSIEAMVQASVESSNAFNAVNGKITETDELVRQIKGAMEEQTQGSIQISQVLRTMNDSSLEVRTASQEMAVGNKTVLEEIQRLQGTTTVIKDSVEEMNLGARKIAETSEALDQIVEKINTSISDIGEQVDKFTV